MNRKKDLEHQVEAEARVKDRVEEVIPEERFHYKWSGGTEGGSFCKENCRQRNRCTGETVTYQICIVNTGENTLHSVVGTERFQAAGIHAQFLGAGRCNNSSRTKAMIQQIPPGEAVSLQAVVKIPGKSSGSEAF